MAYDKISRQNKYPEVKQLPASAMTIPEFADKENVGTPYIYNLHKQGKLADVKKVKIVVFKGYNFVIPAI